MPDHFEALTINAAVGEEIVFHDPTDGLPVRGFIVAIDKAARTIAVNCGQIARFRENKQPVTFAFGKAEQLAPPVAEPPPSAPVPEPKAAD